ncbi:MAG: gliding motility-associated C-terminal domain-containing protein [Bacteroidales bacterium]|nr:gliding motility-associated C-terminal domain-containing protein [Bacteroidales bacterium]
MNIKRRLILLLSIFYTTISQAGFHSVGATGATTVGADSVFFFKNIADARVAATDNDAQKIEWFAFSDADKSFSSLIKSKDATTDTLSPETEGGYMVRITTASGSSEKRFWCFAPKIESAQILVDTIDCESMSVEALVEADTMRVFDTELSVYSSLPQKLTYSWHLGDSLLLNTKYKSAELESPTDDGALTLEVVNQAGNTATATDSITAINVKAAFSYTPREHNIDNEISKGDALSAPAEVEFKNESKGKYTVCEWVMGNASRLFDEDPVYSFQKSGTYTVSLIVTNENSTCSSVDSTLQITVTDSAIDFPNVFSPNGDGVNDEFRPAYKSIKSYRITIYNRWGRKVYSSTDPSTGWDGKIGNSNAAEGVYMYVAEAEGFDKGVSFRRKGSVTLIR